MVNEVKEDIMTMSHQIKIIKKDTEIISLKEQNGMSETWNYNNWNEKVSQRVSGVDSELAEETINAFEKDWWRLCNLMKNKSRMKKNEQTSEKCRTLLSTLTYI